jgi:peroxiredoxin
MFLLRTLCAAWFLWAGLAFAEKKNLHVGDVAPVFALKAVHQDASGDLFLGVDTYVGSEASRPKKMVAVVFATADCKVCKEQMEWWSLLHGHYMAKGVQVLWVVSEKDQEKIDVYKTLAKEWSVPFPVLVDRFQIVTKNYFVTQWPAVFMVSSEGKVFHAAQGYGVDHSKRVLEDVRKVLGELSTEPLSPGLQQWLLNHGLGVASDPVVSQPVAPAGASKAVPAEDVKKKTPHKKRR